MAKRCDSCRYWNDSVFLGDSESGYGCWEGWCSSPAYKERPYFEEQKHHNLWLACEYHVYKPKETEKVESQPMLKGNE